jgi:hypothetical protein
MTFSEIQVCPLEILKYDLNQTAQILGDLESNCTNLGRSKVFTAMVMSLMFLCIMTLYGLKYQHLKCHFSPEDEDSVSPKLYLPISLHEMTTQKNNTDSSTPNYTGVSQVDLNYMQLHKTKRNLQIQVKHNTHQLKMQEKPPHTHFQILSS